MKRDVSLVSIHLQYNDVLKWINKQTLLRLYFRNTRVLCAGNRDVSKTVVAFTCKIHICKNVFEPSTSRGSKTFLQMFYFTCNHVLKCLGAEKILQNILAVSCLLPNTHEPALLQPITVFPWLRWEWRRAARRRDNETLTPSPAHFLKHFCKCFILPVTTV